MELDELKSKWAEQDRKLETSIRLNRQLLREMYTGRARRAMVRLGVVRGVGAACALALAGALGDFIARNWGMPRFVLPAAALDVFAIGTLAALIAQIVLALQIRYEGPVTAIQKRLARLRTARVRYVQAIFLTATLLWVPGLVVAMKAFLGVDAYRVLDRGWLAANVLLGLAVIPVGLWLARRYGGRFSRSAVGGQLMNGLAGRDLNAATEFIRTLARFEQEE